MKKIRKEDRREFKNLWKPQFERLQSMDRRILALMIKYILLLKDILTVILEMIVKECNK